MGIIQTDPRQSCRHSMTAARGRTAIFSFRKGAQAPPVPGSQGQQRSGTECAASPGHGAVQGVWGATPTSRETDFRRNRRKSAFGICGNKYTACYNGDTPKNGGDGRPMQRPTPKLQWEGTGLTRHCLSCHARLRKLSAGPPIAAFDLRRLRSGQHRPLVSHSKLNR